MQRVEELLGLQATSLLTLPFNLKSSVQFHRNYQQRRLKLRLELIQIADQFGKVCYSSLCIFLGVTVECVQSWICVFSQEA